jgi:hypothetical protein
MSSIEPCGSGTVQILGKIPISFQVRVERGGELFFTTILVKSVRASDGRLFKWI